MSSETPLPVEEDREALEAIDTDVETPQEEPPEAPPTTAPSPTPAEAARVLEEARRARVESCAHAVEAVLRQHGCEIVTRAMITADGRITSGWRIDPTE